MTQPDSSPVCANTADLLFERAQLQPYRPAVWFPVGHDRQGRVTYSHVTFQQLEEDSSAIAAGLEQVGLRQGTRTALLVKPSIEFLSLAFAIVKLGAVPVMIDPGIGLKHLKDCLGHAEPEAFVGIPLAHVARKLLRWASETVRINVTVGPRLPWGGFTLDHVRSLGRRSRSFRRAKVHTDDIAAIGFTSGSTGTPKGVVFTHGNFYAQIEGLKQVLPAGNDEIDLPTFPPFALFNPALGKTAVIPDMDPTRPGTVDPVKIIRAIEDFGVTSMFASPALLNRVGRYGVKHGIKLPSLKVVLTAGAPVPAVVQERFLSMLGPHAQIVPAYGATEALPVTTFTSREVLAETRVKTDRGEGVCVGRPVSAAKVFVIEVSDQPISRWSDARPLGPNEVGEIVVKGPMVTRTYYRREEATRLAKIAGDAPGELYHRMGDLGYLDELGRLWFCGRKSQRVESRYGRMLTIPVESVFNTHPAVFRTALVGVQTADGLEPVICVELEEDARGANRAVVAQELKAIARRFEHTRHIEKFLFHPGFPVDIRHNAKIGRETLSKWAQARLGPAWRGAATHVTTSAPPAGRPAERSP